jgi:hypothetical protein
MIATAIGELLWLENSSGWILVRLFLRTSFVNARGIFITKIRATRAARTAFLLEVGIFDLIDFINRSETKL